MKKRLFALLAFALLALPLQAQPYNQIRPNEISTGAGFSAIDFAVGMLDRLNLIYVHPESGAETGLKTGGSRVAMNIGYSRQLNCCVSVGGTFGFNRVSLNGLIYDCNLTLASSNIYSMMATGKFDWFHTRSDVFSMYSKLGLGVMVVQGIVLQGMLNGAIVLPTFQSSFICFEVGQTVRGFFELGIGMQGIVQTGVLVRF